MDIIEKVQGAFNKGSSTASRSVEMARQKNRLKDISQQRTRLTAQLGAVLYEKTKDDPSWTSGLQELYSEIAKLDEDRDSVNAQIQSLTAQEQAEENLAHTFSCPSCGTTCSFADHYCMGCGQPIDDAKPSPSAERPIQNLICPICGNDVEPEDSFCMSCGGALQRKVNSAASPSAESTVLEEKSAVAPSNPAFDSELKKQPERPQVSPIALPSEDISFCPACGQKTYPSDAFCIECGAKLS